MLFVTNYRSPLGEMTIATTNEGLSAIWMKDEREKASHYQVKRNEIHQLVMDQLEQYFSGERRQFDLPLDLEGTPFMLKVWRYLAQIPYGKLVTYKMIAEAIGHPKAYRAVGMANNRNPIPIICACHRVVGSNGDLVGYAYGLAMKRTLLDLEGINY